MLKLVAIALLSMSQPECDCLAEIARNWLINGNFQQYTIAIQRAELGGACWYRAGQAPPRVKLKTLAKIGEAWMNYNTKQS